MSRYRGCVRQAARALLGADAADPRQVDDIEADVWVALCANEGRWLRICAALGCGLTASLVALTRCQVLRWQQEHQRHQERLQEAPLEELVDRRAVPCPVGVLLEELTATLTPQEQRYIEYECRGHDPAEPCPFSRAYRRKLKQRVLRKWQAVLFDQR